VVARATTDRDGRERDDREPGRRELLGIYTNPADPRASHVAFYRVDSYEMDFKPNIEIAEWKFFAPDALPEGVGRGPRNRVAEMAGTRTPDGIW
jgi:hypothetical protein